MVGSLLCFILAPLARLLGRIIGPYIEDDSSGECSTASLLESDRLSDGDSAPRLPLSKDQTALLQDWFRERPGEPSKGESAGETPVSVDMEKKPQDQPSESWEVEEATMAWQQTKNVPTLSQQSEQWQAAAVESINQDQSIVGWQLTSTSETVTGWPTLSTQGLKDETAGWTPALAQNMGGFELPTGWQFQPRQHDSQRGGIMEWQSMPAHMNEPVAATGWQFPTLLDVNAAANDLWQFQSEGNLVMGTDPYQGLLARVWEDLSRSQVDGNDDNKSFEFTIMSYNILSQDLLETNSDLYSHCQPEFLKWEFRFQNILQEFETWQPDILCLQEVQENHYHQQFRPALQLQGYECVYKRRTGIKTDGCAVCYKKERFSLVSEHPVEYFRPIVETLNRDNVALLVLLRPLTPDCVEENSKFPDICVANTHLIFNPRRGDIKLTQLAVLFAEIEQLIHTAGSDGNRCPILLCGDLNSVPESPLYKLIQNGELYYYGMPTWKVSSQEDCSYQMCSRKLYGPLWPSRLRITDSCQYVDMCEKKRTGKRRYGREFLLQLQYSTPALERPENLVFIEGVTDAKPEPPGDGSERYVSVSEPEDELFCNRSPTTLRHNLNLTSVYSHYLPDTGRPEVTTCSSGFGLTVDYIFYSAQPVTDKSGKGRRRYKDGPLKLLGRLSLLSEHDIWLANGLPNGICSSDHLSLLAKFGLKSLG
ncbi:protein angel homolog 1-like isoform X1 [Chiloscyllium plagiosum]|uniref:protein angel homolog 1-like isoform X1 n=1 Tax=Chiloscyllium plagiosum TaxID=36176 RepID=UPI001CB84C56|nr:protein angel homolog 1-like isoform X1 [Chiloscyllium plagiosum]